jgi:fatty-acid desaturase
MDRHPECENKRNKIDVNYLFSDPIVRFQYIYYSPLFLLINVIIPSLMPYYLFDDTIINGFFICFMFRYVYTIQLAMCGKLFKLFT